MNNQHNGIERLLKRLKADPLYEQRQEFGKFLMRHIDSLTPTERKRYDELKDILLKSNYTP
jgi:hypothetical protein